MSRLTITEKCGGVCTHMNTYECNQNLACEDCKWWDEILDKLAYYEDLEEQGRLKILPCNVGDELYRITYPYRQPPKVTKYRVKNFRTIKRG